ncbi:toll/interleukin-1 receptor domain-containing protein [Mesorhizobium sp. M1305]|uniref:toll/interleukin-1 receptor domain-containing protein n=1 Tax=unclassified Mesorhizobium TaxID=325217 RepID=UPI00333BC57F
MFIKVFLSHQSADTLIVRQIAARLERVHGIDSYLALIDPYINGRSEDLEAHIRQEMGSCILLLAVISDSTGRSQWVPWEIGGATEKVPRWPSTPDRRRHAEFLRKLPYLRSKGDLDQYATASKKCHYLNEFGPQKLLRGVLQEPARQSRAILTRQDLSIASKALPPDYHDYE